MKSLILFLALCVTPALWADIEPIHFDAPAAPAPAAQPAAAPADNPAAAKAKKPAKRHTKTRHAKKAPAAKQGT